jgi:CheY-like chemotaxis protein
MQRRKIRILVIDDDLAMLSLYEEYLGNHLGYRVDRASIAGEAARMASETMYDIAICDAKLNYKRSSFGGLLLAEEFGRRFGCNAVLVVSRIVDEDHVRLFDSSLFFLPKPQGSSVERWFTVALPRKLRSLMERQYGFVVMPFGNDHVDVMFEAGLRKGAMRAGFRIVRIDQVKFGESILAKTRQMITDAHFVVLMTAGGNANAFYEAGFAHALGKRLVVCAPAVTDVPFNVREFQCILYQDAAVQLHLKLCEMLNGMRNQ